MSRLNKPARAPVLCYVTDRRSLAGAEAAAAREVLLRKIELIAAAGIDWIQIREKDLSGKDCAILTREALKRVARASESVANAARILVNDRLDVALAENAGGVHLGEKSLPAAEAKRLADDRKSAGNFLIGVSCHSLEAAKSAAQDGASYLFFGPVFTTPSKAAYGAPQGFERLAEVCAAVSIPVLAIGGITLENARTCFSAGAAGIAAIRLFQDAEDVISLAAQLRGLAR